jgi:uncharacterized membrane protein YidH (DUF202 family)
VAGLAVAGSHSVIETPAWLSAIGVPLIGIGGAVGLEGRSRFLRAQRAMRNHEPLEAPRVAMFLPWGIALVAAIGTALAIAQLVMR